MSVVQSWVSDHSAIICLALLLVMLIAFVVERVPAVTVGIVGATAALGIGLVPEDKALDAFSNTAPITIAALFILAAALRRTGVLDELTLLVIRFADKSKRASLGLVGFIAVAASAVVSNTAVVLVLIPLVIKLAERLGISNKRLLLPVSYLSILGGTLTLIGTSSNLLVAGVARQSGMEPFTIFEISAVGGVTVLAGILTLLILGAWLLPGFNEKPRASEPERLFLTDLIIPSGSKYIGRTVDEVRAVRAAGVKLVFHKPANMAQENSDKTLTLVTEGDRFVVRATLPELITLIKSKAFRSGVTQRAWTGGERETVQATLSASDPNIGLRLDKLSYLSDHAIAVRGITRFGNQPGPDLGSTQLHAGDCLVIEGPPEVIDALSVSTPLTIERKIQAVPFQRSHAGIAVLTLAGVIISAAMGLVPLATAALVGIGVVLATGCLSIRDAWESLEGDVLGLIVAMLIFGIAMQASGAVDLIVNASLPMFAVLSPFLIIAAFYFLTSFLTEIVTNAAVAVIMTPIAISLGQSLEVEPRALVVAVMFAASASFASPVGYQTNTLVHAAGSYRFKDFLKIGIPMNIIVGLATSWAILVIFAQP